MNTKQTWTNEQWGGKECETRETRSSKYKNHIVQKDLWNWFGRFMKLLEVKVHYHDIEVYHMSSRFYRIMNQLKKFMKLVEYFGNIGRKDHELAGKLYELEFALQWSRSTKGVIFGERRLSEWWVAIATRPSTYSSPLIWGLSNMLMHITPRLCIKCTLHE